MTKEELVNIKGGASLSASIINAVIRVVSITLELGRAVGSAIKMKKSGKTC